MRPGARGAKRLVSLMLAALFFCQVLPARGQSSGPGARPTILAFDRKGCPICYQMEITLNEVQKQYPGQFEVRRLYIYEEEPTFRHYRVVFVPTQVFLDPAGQEAFRHEGVFPKEELIKKLRQLKFIRD